MSAPPGPEVIRFPPAQFVSAACAYIASAHRVDIPNLTRATLLVPSLHARQAIARELRRAAAVTVLLLPRITTLSQWAGEALLPQRIVPRPAREAIVYQALAEKRWFEHSDLWAIAGELLALFDELTRWKVGMPASLDDFQQRLEQAYRARAGASFAVEARLVHDLWHALAATQERADAEAAYQLKLGVLARTVADPVYVLGVETLAPSERDFIAACSRRVRTVLFVEDRVASPSMSNAERALALAWQSSATSTLRARAEQMRHSSAMSALRGRVRFLAAHGIEHEAAAIEITIRRWLHCGRQNIGVVVLDRLTARRARALLERAQILVRDEAGWPFSTTSAATILSRWFDVCADDYYHRDLLDLLKSPFAFSDWTREVRQEAVWRLERRLREANVRTGLENYIALARGDAELRQLLLRVQRAAAALGTRARKSLARWLSAVAASLDELGVSGGYAKDAAGSQLFELMQRLGRELAESGALFTFGEFRHWFGRQLESASFLDSAIDSPVIFTGLHATRLRRFDAVLIVGADASTLAACDSGGLFFNESVRRELGLPGWEERTREIEADLFSLLANTPETVVTWQMTRDGETNLLAPIFERLRSVHRLAWNDDLAETLPAPGVHLSRSQEPGMPNGSKRPAPATPPDLVPGTISASGYNSLVACPYQFFARYVLRLRQLDDVQEELEKSDYGSRIHEILHAFHRAHPCVLALSADAAQAALAEMSIAAFRDVTDIDFMAGAWLARWRKLIPSYIAWQRQREEQGWRVVSGELDRSITIKTAAGRTFTLRGRIDRVDAREADDAVAVIDYKTQARRVLEGKLAERGEDVQLPVYALLWGGPVAAALFLSADGKEIVPVAAGDDIEELAREVSERLANVIDRLHEGARLPAQGVDAVCRYCDVAGLCRRKHWA